MNGQVVVHYDGCFHSIDEEFEQINSSRVDLRCLDQSLYAIWELGHRAENSQEVAISETPLAHIRWLYAVCVHLWVGVDIGDPLPLYLAKLLNIINVTVFLGKGGENWREDRIYPGLACINSALNKVTPRTP